MDSQVLLHAAAAVRDRLPPELRAVHLDHGLHPDAPQWADHCRASCTRLALPLEVLRLGVRPRRGESLEAAAREARYAALASLLESGDLLLTAHHRRDQAETLLLALMRGSGVRGLAAMSVVSPLGTGRLVRPLLDVRRAELAAYARRHGLGWVSDPSNQDLDRDRNFLRHRVLPVLVERWPAAEVALARTAGHCLEADHLIADLAAQTVAGLSGGRPATLSIRGLGRLDPALRRAVLRHWIAERGFRLPDRKHLGRILSEVMTARSDATPLVAWSGCEIRRHRDDLFVLPPLPAVPGSEVLRWSTAVLRLPSDLGELRLLDSEGAEMDPKTVCAGGLRVRFGVHGVSWWDQASGHHRSLKKLFQEGGVPAWLRPYVPLVFAQDALMGVGGLSLRWPSGPEERRSLVVRWEGCPWRDLVAFARCQSTP
jgi:tRNA(Ile)-lysidine synthase